MVPGVGEIISVADTLTDGAKALTAWRESRTLRDVEIALGESRNTRAAKIRDAISGLKTAGEKGGRLLEAVGLLSDVHGIAIARA